MPLLNSVRRIAKTTEDELRDGILGGMSSSQETVPVFEGGWCCSAECLLVRVNAALRRESSRQGTVNLHRHRIPLGLAMLEQGWITAEELRRALEVQRAAGEGRLGQWLVRSRAASEVTVTRALALQWNCPVLSLDAGAAEPLTALLPRLFVDAFGALPLRIAAEKILYLGFEERLDPALALGLERMLGLRVESGIVRESRFRAAHHRILGAQFPPVELIEAATHSALAKTLTVAIERARPCEARLVRVHDFFWLRLWHRNPSNQRWDASNLKDLICTLGETRS